MAIRLQDFDDLVSGNKYPIHLVQHEITLTSPVGSEVRWTYPGYVSIVLESGTEIAFGESLEKDSGYSWNSYDLEGTSDYCDSYEDLKDIKKIVSKLWEQVAPLLEKEGEVK
jgi:hypothetical protein